MPIFAAVLPSLPFSLRALSHTLSHSLAFGAALWAMAPAPASADQILDFSTLDEIESALPRSINNCRRRHAAHTQRGPMLVKMVSKKT